MKKLMIIMIFLSSICWSASFKVGFSKNYQYFKDYKETFSTGNHYYLGFGYNFEITDKTSFCFESLLGYNDSDNGFNDKYNVGTVKSILIFLDVPFYFNYTINDYLILYSGGYVSLPIIGQASSAEYIEGTEIENVKYDDSAVGGLLTGVKIPVSGFYIDLRYKLGLVTLYRNTTVFEHNFILFAGVDF